MEIPSNAGIGGRSFGFPGAPPGQRPDPVARPTPLPKRPKGRWFVAVTLLASCLWGVHGLWQAFFRYDGYGIVVGRSIEISPPWDGLIQYLHVREGERVEQGQLLATLDNVELRQRHAQLADELAVAQANQQAEIAKLKWECAFNMDHGQGATAKYYEAMGTFLQEQARLEELQNALERAESLHRLHGLSDAELDRIRINKEGQEQKLAKLKESLERQKMRADLADLLLANRAELNAGLIATGNDQLKPGLARIEYLQAERARAEERLTLGQVRAPTSGLVIRTHHFVGERCKASEPVLRILERGSLQAVVYLPQESSQRFAIGDRVDLVCQPYREPLVCKVVRLGEEYELAPEQIKRHYAAGKKLLPVYMEPCDEAARWMALRVGETVKLPLRWSVLEQARTTKTQ